MTKINLISDTVTKPTQGMLHAMMNAEVGDDVFGEDPSINELEDYAARLFGMEASLFCPSGTMANQISVKLHTQPLDEVICDKTAHVYNYETGGWAMHSGVSIQLIEGQDGIITKDQVEAAIRPDHDWLPKSSLVVIENTCNKAGGTYYTMEDILPIHELCRSSGLRLHLDGARLFNALIETGEKPEQYGEVFDTISLCLSKGLGAPVGSLIISSKSKIKEARRLRKAMGGGMRQAGFLAAAGKYALEQHIPLLKEDHKKCEALADALRHKSFVINIRPVKTNILIFDVDKDWGSADTFISKLKQKDIHCVAFGPQTIRMVTHMDVSHDEIQHVVTVINNL